MGSSHFWIALSVIVLASLGIRLGYVAAYQFVTVPVYGHPCEGKSNYPGCLHFLHHSEKAGVGGDALYYHDQAHLLVDGKIFVNPTTYYETGAIHPSANHPPLQTVLLAMEDFVGLTSVDDQRIAGCFLGALTVLVVALVARRIGGNTTALAAATIAALYPGMWIFDGTDMAEALSILLIAYLLHETYRYWRQPTLKLAAWVGVIVALTAYARSELVLLAVLLVLPLAALRPSPQGRLKTVALSLGALVLTLAPWVGWNMARFDKPELLSSQFGITMVVSNCPSVYSGPFTGFWDLPKCQVRPHHGPRPPKWPADESVTDAYWRSIGFNYMRANIGRYPLVLLAREGRVWWLYHPAQQAILNAFIEQWDLGASQMFRWSFYLLGPLALAGGFMLRRKRDLPLFPMMAPFVVVVAAVLVTYGTTRFQSAAEPTIVLLAAVSVTWAVESMREKVKAHRRVNASP